MSGVPASEISASACPSAMRSQRARARLGGVVLVIGRERRLDPVAREQRARYAGVLGQDRIRAGQNRQRPQRHVGEVADRRRDDVKAGIERRPGQNRVADDERFDSSDPSSTPSDWGAFAAVIALESADRLAGSWIDA